jgi:surfeit locus 1 family protein
MSSSPAAELRRLRFRPGLGATLAALAGIALLVALGSWQLQRLAWKTALIATMESRLALPATSLDAVGDEAEFRRVAVSGRYRHDLAFAKGAEAMAGELGARLVTPLLLDDGRTLLVERGWLPEPLLPPRTPRELEPAGEVALEGVLRFPTAPGLFTPANRPEARRWYWYDSAALTSVLGVEPLPIIVTLDRSDTAGPLPRPLPVRVDLPSPHLGYAVTWFGLAAALLGVYLAFGLTRAEK